MNWTGGALGRSRNARTSLSIKQKKHFAKARGKLPTARPSPPSIRFEFAGLPHGSKGRDFLQSGSGYSQGCKDKQTEPNQAVDKAPSIMHQGSLNWSRGLQKQSDEKSAEDSPMTVESRPSSVSTLHSEGAMHRPALDHPTSFAGEDSLEAKRCQLLSMSDWVGISHLKPAKVDFANIEDRDQIGKRRRLSQVHDNLQAHPKRLKRTSYFEPPTFHSDSDDNLSQAGISVRIGSAVDESMTHDGKGGPQSMHDGFNSLSDEMLFDERFSNRAPSLSKSGQSDSSCRANDVAVSQSRQRRVLTPSAFIDKSSPSASETEITSDIDQGGPADVRRQIMCQDDAYFAEGALYAGFHRPQTPAQFRLAFDQTPRPHFESSEATDNSLPLTRDLSFDTPKTKDAPFRPQLFSEGRSVPSPVRLAPSSTASNRATGFSPFSKATSKDLGELQFQASRKAHLDLKRQVNNTLRQIAPLEVRLGVERDSRTLEDKVVETDHNEHLHLQRQKPSTSLEPIQEAKVTEASLKEGASSVEKQDYEKPAPAEDEERIWRSFVFGNDEENNSRDLGHQLEKSSQEQREW